VLLVVDDDEPSRCVTARMLTDAGFNVVTAASGVHALELIANSRGARPRLAVIDVAMPGMNGVELAARMADRTPETRILFMSGATSPRSGHALPAPYLPKPFSQQDLVRRVWQLLADD
jgi:two-component system, cell cycle sensor histidine kinase and response regulator CckA